MTTKEKIEPVPYSELSPEQLKKAAAQQCPFCDSTMRDLNPESNPKAREFYCEQCHWSLPVGRLQ
jgi:hypothetical protein